MPLKEHSRQYDLVILGATGYTGKLTAEHLATHLPTNSKWAIAGRSESKLQSLADECAKLSPDAPKPAIEIFDINDGGQISALVNKAALVITAVGPYCRYGEPVFKACAEAGTHYVDCTGEVPWVGRMIQKYDETARESGAIMIPQNGLESAAADLCTWAMVRHLRRELDAPAKDVAFTFHKADLTASGGTLSTFLTIWDYFSMDELRKSFKPYALSPVPHPEKARPSMTLSQMLLGLRAVPGLGLSTTSVFGMADASVVERSWGLLSQIPTRKDQFYGPRFNWAEYHRPRNWLHGIIHHWSLILGLLVVSLLPPVRALVSRFVYQPGEGISKEQMETKEAEFRGTAEPDTPSPTGKQAFCRAQFRGSLYQLTAVYLAQAALTILQDDVGLDGGVYTPACLGQGYVDRVNDAGFTIDVKLIEKQK
ncbi:hypothetical protein HIM_01674 [Hirsutella minnesotensis 3608]|nr:hypothetical protein HIM_01674 [Hirsutella minnesotensis 3608]